MFQVYGGVEDYLLVGTRDTLGDNRFYAIDPYNGGPPLDFFDDSAGAGIGIINGMAAVDYANNRVVFASRKRGGGADTLWCLNLLASPPPAFSLAWSHDFGDIDSSPVMMGGRVYVVGDLSGGRLYSVDAVTGGFYAFNIGDGQVKDFIWPDWRNPGDLYFAADTSIHPMHDNGSNLVYQTPPGGPVGLGGASPTSGVLVVPGTQLLYVGADDGHLYEIDFSQDPPFVKSVQLGDGGAVVGSPSLDWHNDLIHVGTEAGVFYAVDTPLP
jgi:outer membrane protein assembly factor BamB